MSKVPCPHCNKEVLKSNMSIHQRSKTCQTRQLENGVDPRKTSQQLETELKLQLEEMKDHLSDLNENNRELLIENIGLRKEKSELSESNKELLIEVSVLRSKTEIYENLYGELKEEKKEDHKDMKSSLLQLASKPTVNNTNNTRNTQNIFQQLAPLDLSIEQIKALGEVTLEQFQQGAKGAVEWMRPMLTDHNGNFKLHITDKNRGRLEYKNMDGTKETDVNCEKIMEVVKPLLEPQLLKLKKSLDLVVIDQYAYDEEANQVGGLVSRKIKETKTLKANFMDNKLVFKELQKQKA
jgi:hypothetical protein